MKKLLLSSFLLGILAFGQITIYPTGGGGGYATIQDEGSSLNQRVTVNFLGSGVTCVDNPGASKTDCTISGGGGGSLSVPQTSQSGASYSLVSGDCGKWLLLTNAAPTLTVPAPLSGASDGCAIFVHPTAGNATLQTGVSATVYRNQVALLQYNGSTWNLDYSQFTNDPAGSITFSRDVNGVTSASLDTSVPRDFEGTFNVTETGNLRFEGTNNGTGTVASRLAKLAAANTLTVMATSDTDEPLGVCVSGCGNSGTAVVVFRGNVACEADNTVAANDWISIGTTTAGRCKSEGGTEPTSGWILGRARTGASAGSTFTLLLQPRKAGGGSSAFSAITSGTNTAAAMVAGAGSSFRANAADATAPSKSGTSLPGTCTVGDTYVKTDAATAAQLHLCTATNTWTQQIGTGSAFDPFDFTVMKVQERWCGTANGGGPTLFVGELFWRTDNLGGSSTLTLSGDGNHPCFWQIVTGAASGNGEVVAPSTFTSQTAFGFAYGNDGTWEMRFVGQINTIASTDFGFGLQPGVGSDLLSSDVNRIRIKRLSGGSTFVFDACSASAVCTTSNSTITPSDATTFTLRMRSTTAGTILYSVNGETEVSIGTANVPTATLYPAIEIKTATTATRQLRLFGWGFQKTGMTP